jgi:hypothetical protein
MTAIFKLKLNGWGFNVFLPIEVFDKTWVSEKIQCVREISLDGIKGR